VWFGNGPIPIGGSCSSSQRRSRDAPGRAFALVTQALIGSGPLGLRLAFRETMLGTQKKREALDGVQELDAVLHRS
jgi:hypothetical protein